MPRPLVDLLWRAADGAPTIGRRGPKAKHSTDDVVTAAISLADTGGLGAVTVRALALALGMTAMSVYTHVNSRDDLLVLMVDDAHAQMARTPFGRSRIPTRLRRVGEDNLILYRLHPWLLDVDDQRTALGPGTIAKYDHELRAFDGAAFDDVARDAALTFLLDFVRASAARMVRPAADFTQTWQESAGPLATYIGDDFPLAQRVGRAAGEAMGGPYDARSAWEFGLTRVISALVDD